MYTYQNHSSTVANEAFGVSDSNLIMCSGKGETSGRLAQAVKHACFKMGDVDRPPSSVDLINTAGRNVLAGMTELKETVRRRHDINTSLLFLSLHASGDETYLESCQIGDSRFAVLSMGESNDFECSYLSDTNADHINTLSYALLMQKLSRGEFQHRTAKSLTANSFILAGTFGFW